MNKTIQKTNEFRRFCELSVSLAKAGFKLRYEGTWLGILWYLLNPLLTFLLLLGIFTDRLGQSIPHYPIYLLLGLLLFNFAQRITSEATIIIKANGGLIKALDFPREALIASTLIMTLFAHIFELLVLMIFLAFFGVPIYMMIFYPIILLFLSMFTFGFSLILASLNTHFFDLENVWSFVVRLVWFATPIFYAIEGQTKLFYLNMLNPMYFFIEIARDIVIYTKMPELWMIIVAICYSLVFLSLGLIIFKLLKKKFAELV